MAFMAIAVFDKFGPAPEIEESSWNSPEARRVP
jgi:hypothetical protein